MSNYKILIVDDEARMRKLLKDFLERDEYDVLEASNGKEAVEVFKENKDISLVILDVMMPEMDGWEACKFIREDSEVPIIMLTAKDTEDDELESFDSGADEFITKPVSPGVLIARIGAILRRTYGGGSNSVLSLGGIVADKESHIVTVDGQEIELSFKEFELLVFFMENQGIALSREKILNAVWNYDYFGDARTIDTHVKKLRQKLLDKGEFIKTIWGMGYKFEVLQN